MCMNKEDDKSPKSCSTLIFNLILGIFILLLFVTIVLISYLYYFAFAAICLFTFHSFANEWISLITRNIVDYCIRILTNFFDFGLFFTLALICVYVVSDYCNFVIWLFKRVVKLLKYRNINENSDRQLVNRVYICLFFGYAITVTFIALFFKYLNQYIIFIFAAFFEVVFLIIVFTYKPIKYLIDRFCPKYINQQQAQNSAECENDDKENISISENSSDFSSNDKKCWNLEIFENSLLFVGSLDGMFDNTFEGKDICCGSKLSYKIVLSFLTILSQGYSIIYPFAKGVMSVQQFIIVLLFKICFMYKSCAYNFFDFLNINRVFHSLKHKKAKVTYAVMFMLFIASFSILLQITLILAMKNSQAKSALFIENNQTWFKSNNDNIITPQGFCFTKAQNDGFFQTDDLAMLTTLPRLYNISKDGKCYLIPSKRGLFNSTMKYIFGKNYEDDGIRIMCRKMSHYPFLIITSDKILNQTLSYYPNKKNIKFVGKQFDIKNTNYFENHRFTDLNDEGKSLLSKYENCAKNKGTKNCEMEWDSFTQYYWPNMHTDKYEDIKGFERYQINIDPNMIIQPSFITENGELLAGTHYIVGGSYEDKFGSGLMLEMFLRSLLPAVMDNFLILFSAMRKMKRDVFISLEWLNRQIFYIELVSLHEMASIPELYSQFNFSHISLYTVGHSISGTAFKGSSYFNDIQGIAFDSSTGENIINLNENFKITQLKDKISNSFNQITNIYSSGNPYSGNDENCDVNGVLPPRYSIPNVFDTACLTAITCSQSMKYVPLCKQVLYSPNGKTAEEEFNESFDAYLNYYGYA